MIREDDPAMRREERRDKMSPRVVRDYHNRTPSALPWSVLIAALVVILVVVLGYFGWLAANRGPGGSNVTVTSPSQQPSSGNQPATPGAGPQTSSGQTGTTPSSGGGGASKPSAAVTPSGTNRTAQPGGGHPSAAGKGGTNAQGGGHPALPAVKVSMSSDNTFNPSDITVPAGAEVKWTNTDSKPHTVTSAKSGGPDSDVAFPNGIPSGKSYTWNVPADAASGTTYYYYCQFHGQPGTTPDEAGSGMAGSITVQ